MHRTSSGTRLATTADTVVEVRPARDVAELEQALALRYRVFCEEQGVSERSERDGRDGDGALHLVALADGRLVGTCRLITSRRTVTLSRMAVEADFRRSGAGAALLVRRSPARGAGAQSASASTPRHTRCRSTSAPAT